MIRSIAIAALLGATAPPAFAQDICPTITPPTDPCLVGAWVGVNSAGLKITEMLNSMTPSGTTRSVMPAIPTVLGMQVYPDGFYITLPFNAATSFKDVDNDTGEVTTAHFDLRGQTQVGHIWGDDGQMFFCDGGSGGAMLQATVSSGGNTASETIVPGGGAPFMPMMRYSCTPHIWTFTVELPAPIGEVNYALERVPSDRLADEVRESLDRIARR